MGGAATPLLSAAYTGTSSLMTALAIGAGMAGYGTYYGVKSIPLLKRQLNLTTNKKIFMKTSELRKINNLKNRVVGTAKEKKKDERRTYLGRGYSWGSEHANRAYQVMDMDTDMSQVDMPFFLKPIIKAMSKETEELGGKAWIHGMGDEKPVMVKDSNWFGHTIITGNVGSGKTTLLRLMSLNALHLGNVLVVLDPKNDVQWKDSIKRELEYLGMGDRFYHLHPAHPSTSVRIPLLSNFTRLTEIADRIAPLMGGSGSGKAFQDFAYDIIFKTAQALDFLGEPVRLTRISKVVTSDRRGLALRVMRKYYDETMGQGWEERLARQFAEYSPERLEAMAAYYQEHLTEEYPSKVVDGMITFSLHEQGHYSKMVVSLIPILTRLTADPLDELFSPVDDPEVDDPRPIVDLDEIVECGGCIYISLDSLTDGTTAADVSKIVLSELAAIAGRRYNSGDMKGRRVTVANDEVHASIENNDALINILAQGRASLFELILATQTISDLEAKTDAATANRFLGLCNNFMTMRTTDPRTQEYATAQFAKASVSSNQVRTGTFTDTTSSLMSFSAGFQETLTKTREDAFPPSLFGDLPILQYVARLADGKRLKMRLPIIIDDEEDEDIAEWAINEEH
jgi:conjugal transfer pilus assembly protein TraD